MTRPRISTKWQTAGICLALAAITFAVFAQTVTHKFVAYDDDDYVYNNPMVAARVDGERARLGLHPVSFRQLASFNVDFPHGDCQYTG